MVVSTLLILWSVRKISAENYSVLWKGKFEKERNNKACVEFLFLKRNSFIALVNILNYSTNLCKDVLSMIVFVI